MVWQHLPARLQHLPERLLKRDCRPQTTPTTINSPPRLSFIAPRLLPIAAASFLALAAASFLALATNLDIQAHTSPCVPACACVCLPLCACVCIPVISTSTAPFTPREGFPPPRSLPEKDFLSTPRPHAPHNHRLDFRKKELIIPAPPTGQHGAPIMSRSQKSEEEIPLVAVDAPERAPEPGIATTVIAVDGMTCGACTAALEGSCPPKAAAAVADAGCRRIRRRRRNPLLHRQPHDRARGDCARPFKGLGRAGGGNVCRSGTRAVLGRAMERLLTGGAQNRRSRIRRSNCFFGCGAPRRRPAGFEQDGGFGRGNDVRSMHSCY